MATNEYDLIVIGAGPGGYVAAIRAAQLGWKVACVEKEPALGGTCLRIGCIPSKALLESSQLFWETNHKLKEHGIQVDDVRLDLATMQQRKERVVSTLARGIEALFKKNKITRYLGVGRITAVGSIRIETGNADVQLKTRNIVIATGSKPASLPGVVLDGQRTGTSTEALLFDSVPRHLVVIGAGAIGLELGSVWRRLGAKVTVLEYLNRIVPGVDAEIAAEAQKVFERQGLEFRLGTRVTSAKTEGSACEIHCEGTEAVSCDRVLVAVGRVPNTDGLGLEAIGLTLDQRGCIPVDEHFATSVPGIYAIGDVIRGPMLAHKAEEEGIACVEHLVTGYGHVNYDAIPNVVYTQPEIASVGKTENQLKQEQIDYRTGIFRFRANGRAQTLGHTDGMVKLLAHAKTDRILGVHIVGMHAGDLINEAAVAIAFGASSEDLARASHAHPTLPEALKEAALAADGRAIHA
jgi:dihydrolipoamide dehydrogenase